MNYYNPQAETASANSRTFRTGVPCTCGLSEAIGVEK